MKLTKTEPMHYCPSCADDDTEECSHPKQTRKHVLVLPGCCEASKKACFPRGAVRIDWESEEGNTNPDHWTSFWYVPFGSPDEGRDVWQRTRDYSPLPDVTHCPFCGTKLPEIVRDPNPPTPIASHDDCGHCNCGWPRSYGMCACWPRVAVYNVKAA